MKRKDILNKVKNEDSKFDVNEIIETDSDFVKDEIYAVNKGIRENTKAIKSFLKNPDLAIDQQFVTLVKESKFLKAQIEVLEEIQESYL